MKNRIRIMITAATVSFTVSTFAMDVSSDDDNGGLTPPTADKTMPITGGANEKKAAEVKAIDEKNVGEIHKREIEARRQLIKEQAEEDIARIIKKAKKERILFDLEGYMDETKDRIESLNREVKGLKEILAEEKLTSEKKSEMEERLANNQEEIERAKIALPVVKQAIEAERAKQSSNKQQYQSAPAFK